MNVLVEVEVTKAGARVLFRVKFMLFEKAAHRSYNLMPGSIDEEHTEMIWIVPTVHTRAFCPAAAQGQLPAFCFKAPVIETIECTGANIFGTSEHRNRDPGPK